MRKTLTITYIALACAAAQANADTKPQPELLSMQYMNEGNIAVALPTIRNADGTICISYVAEVSRDTDGKISTTVKQICGEANASNSAPRNLVALKNFESGGIVIQNPTVDVDR
ncbi:MULTISPECIES: hypothetical protein [unclassified Burkholderia]|uniref:hypothetical protein n=1 Tax=unclassified Burkholderia TaxID=2613784 RepID=UPI002AB02AF6|nr:MULTISPECIES: hypothetical protein [unclassified Burkholderia]